MLGLWKGVLGEQGVGQSWGWPREDRSQGGSRVERSVGQTGEMEGQGVAFRLNSKDSDKMLRGSSPDRDRVGGWS